MGYLDSLFLGCRGNWTAFARSARCSSCRGATYKQIHTFYIFFFLKNVSLKTCRSNSTRPFETCLSGCRGKRSGCDCSENKNIHPEKIYK